MRFDEILLSFLASVGTNVVISFFLSALATHPQRWWIVMALVGCGTTVTAGLWLARRQAMLRRMGISALLPSTIEGRGSTCSILRTVRDQFAFMSHNGQQVGQSGAWVWGHDASHDGLCQS